MKESFDATKHTHKNEHRERMFRDMIAKEENGEIEVPIDYGYIDVLTSSKVIEIKNVIMWKGAIGQVIVYGFDYPEKEKWVYLFNDCSDDKKEHIMKMCDVNNVHVKFLDDIDVEMNMLSLESKK